MDIKKEIEIAEEQLINFQKYQKFCSEQRFKKESDAIENLERVERLAHRIAHLSKRLYDLKYAYLAQEIGKKLKQDKEFADNVVDEVVEEFMGEFKSPVKIYPNGIVEIKGNPSVFTNEAGLEEINKAMQKEYLTMGDWDNPDQRTNNQRYGDNGIV